MNWQTIYKHLKSNDFDVYSLGQHKGECKSPYIVLRNNGTTINGSVADRRYEILFYVPVSQYSSIEDYVESVKKCMQKLFPAVRLKVDESTHYLDNDVNAYMTSVEYTAPHVADYVGNL